MSIHLSLSFKSFVKGKNQKEKKGHVIITKQLHYTIGKKKKP